MVNINRRKNKSCTCLILIDIYLLLVGLSVCFKHWQKLIFCSVYLTSECSNQTARSCFFFLHNYRFYKYYLCFPVEILCKCVSSSVYIWIKVLRLIFLLSSPVRKTNPFVKSEQIHQNGPFSWLIYVENKQYPQSCDWDIFDLICCRWNINEALMKWSWSGWEYPNQDSCSF